MLDLSQEASSSKAPQMTQEQASGRINLVRQHHSTYKQPSITKSMSSNISPYISKCPPASQQRALSVQVKRLPAPTTTTATKLAPPRNPSSTSATPPRSHPMHQKMMQSLEADVIGGSGAGTKRGAVNLDGYDSDSDNEGFDARAEERAKSTEREGC